MDKSLRKPAMCFKAVFHGHIDHPFSPRQVVQGVLQFTPGHVRHHGYPDGFREYPAEMVDGISGLFRYLSRAHLVCDVVVDVVECLLQCSSVVQEKAPFPVRCLYYSIRQQLRLSGIALLLNDEAMPRLNKDV